MIGRTLSHFEVTAKLGEGGMGEVYRARDSRLGREVAIKTLPPALAADPERRNRFLREARAVAALNHDHICTLYDVGDEAGVLFLVFELLEGENLADRLGRESLPLDESLRLAADVADALSAAHRLEIVHRDLKPANIHITRQGRAKVLDFGLAKVTGRESTPQGLSQSPTALATAEHTILGTAGYMSPEQVRGFPVDQQADVWAFGVVVHEMLTGRRLFEGGTLPDVLAAVLTAPIELEPLPPSIPTEVRELLALLLDRDLDRRPRHLVEARGILEAAASTGPRESAIAAPSSVSGLPGSDGGEKALLVLPFANLSPDPDNEYFSDGLTEEVISDLSRVGSLRVISRTSAMRLKGTDRDIASLARELAVDSVLEGSVRRAGSSIRITAQLVDAANDSLVWSDKYNGTVDDVFAIQERVSRAIVSALELHVTGAEAAALAKPAIADPRAWDVYLRARHAINLFTPGDLERAANLLQQALEMVGPHPLLHRGLGMLCWQYVNSGIDADPGRLREAERRARRCLELDPEGPHGPAILGLVSQARGDLAGWVRHLSRAAELDPGDVDVQVWLSHGWNCAGRPERARPLLERLRAVDPLFDFVHFGLGNLSRFDGRPAEAERHYRRARALTPENPGFSMVLADCIGAQGEPERALALLEELPQEPESHPLAAVCHLQAAAFRGDEQAMDRLLRPTLKASLWHDVQYPRFVAAAWSVLGRMDESLDWLERCADNGFIARRFYAGPDRLLDNVRADPRFGELLARIQERWRRFPAECGA
jgi:serine/threonine protein kinase/tetratricopeptide (TPR) repeat protein